jgi:ribosome biogenesis GTPase
MTMDLRSLGWGPYFAAAYAAYDRPSRRPARVMRTDHGVCTVLGESGAVRASLAGSILTAAAHDPAALPCAGDWVVVHTWPDRRITVESVLPRRGVVARAGAFHGRALAANLDIAAVVEPLDQGPDARRIERLLDLAAGSGAQPVVILTKADVGRRPGQLTIAAPIHLVSARTGEGVAELRRCVGYGRTLGLLGPVGAGKSSLVQVLAGTVVLATPARHALTPLPTGGGVIDTPGVRAADLDGAAEALVSR